VDIPRRNSGEQLSPKGREAVRNHDTPSQARCRNVLDGVGAQDIQHALGISAATYYRRKVQDDYPNAEELRLIARYFGMNFVSLLSVFGLLEGDTDNTGGEVVPPLALLTRPKAKTKQRNDSVDLKGPSL
jgi:hypothetical protein